MLSSSRLNLLASIQALPRDLRLLFLSLFLWTFGLGLYNYIWPLYLRDLQASPGDVGLVFSIGFLALALSMIPGGILANKYELKALLIIGWAMSIPPPLMYYSARTWTDVIPGIVLFQVSGFNVPAFNAYIAGAAERAKSASNFGITWASAPLGVVFSPLVGSVLLNWIPVRSIFILTFVFFSISTIVLFFMKPQPPLESDARSPRLEFPKSPREGSLLLYLAGAAFAWSVASPFIPLYFQDALSIGFDHTTSRCPAVSGCRCLRHSPREESGREKPRRDHGSGSSPIFNRSCRNSSDQKPPVRVSNGLPHRKRQGAEPRCLLHSFNCAEGSFESGIVRVLLDAREPGVCIGILPRWVTLHSKPNKHLLYNVGVVHSPCNPSLGELPKED